MKRYRSHTGFTLIEVVAALTVMFIGIIAICALFPASFRMAEHSKVLTRMTLIGQSKLDELIGIGFAHLPAGTQTITAADLARFESRAAERQRYANSSITITDLETNPLNSQSVLKQIDVTIAYEIRPGKDKTETFTTYISNPLHG